MLAEAARVVAAAAAAAARRFPNGDETLEAVRYRGRYLLPLLLLLLQLLFVLFSKTVRKHDLGKFD